MKFLRTGTKRYKKLGRKKKQKWRKPRGRDNKMREKRKGRPKKVMVGFKKGEKERGKVEGKRLVYIRNLKQAENVGKGDLIIISRRIGKKKREEIEKKIKEKGGVLRK